MDGWMDVSTMNNNCICENKIFINHLTCAEKKVTVFKISSVSAASTICVARSSWTNKSAPPDTTLTQQHQLWIRPMKVLPHRSSLQEERHQLQLHPPVSGDNGSLRLRDSKSRPGSVTPTMRVSSSVLCGHIMHSSKKYEPPSSQKCSLGHSQTSLLTDRRSPTVSLTLWAMIQPDIKECFQTEYTLFWWRSLQPYVWPLIWLEVYFFFIYNHVICIFEQSITGCSNRVQDPVCINLRTFICDDGEQRPSGLLNQSVALRIVCWLLAMFEKRLSPVSFKYQTHLQSSHLTDSCEIFWQLMHAVASLESWQ